MPFTSDPIPRLPASRDHGYSRRLDHWRPLLPVGEAIRFVLVSVDPAELLAVGVKDGDEKMVMLASFVFVEICFFSHWGLRRRSFCHRGHPYFVP